MSSSKINHRQLITIYSDFESQTRISLSNENILINRKDKAKTTYPLAKIHTILVIGDITLTTPFINKCLKSNVAIILSDFVGRYICTLSPTYHNLLLKKHQINEGNKLSYAQKIIIDKSLNQLVLLKKRKYKISKSSELVITGKILETTSINSLLGVEGNLAQSYYKSIFSKINWSRRTPRLKHDIPNALLDMGYMRLYYLTESILSLFGFDRYIGYLHTDYHQRKSLVCDFMEPFRPIVDNILLNLYSRNQINEDDFRLENGKYCPRDPAIYQVYSSYFLKELSNSAIEIYDYISVFSNEILKDK